MGSFFLTMILILAIAIVFDISEKIDDFQNGATMNEIVFDYYINFVAFYGNLFSALILFISTIWFTSRIIIQYGTCLKLLIWLICVCSFVWLSLEYVFCWALVVTVGLLAKNL